MVRCEQERLSKEAIPTAFEFAATAVAPEGLLRVTHEPLAKQAFRSGKASRFNYAFPCRCLDTSC
jgi:hypothetical protein